VKLPLSFREVLLKIYERDCQIDLEAVATDRRPASYRDRGCWLNRDELVPSDIGLRPCPTYLLDQSEPELYFLLGLSKHKMTQVLLRCRRV